MATFVEDFAALIVEVVEVPGDSNVEATSKTLLSQFVKAVTQALKLQSLADAGDGEILGVSGSLIKLALQFNRAFKHLTIEEKAQINEVVKGIVTGANQIDIETFFDDVLNIVGTGQSFGAELTVLLETPVEP